MYGRFYLYIFLTGWCSLVQLSEVFKYAEKHIEKLLYPCFNGGFNEEIQLFDGAICESQFLRRSVLVVAERSWLELKFKVGLDSSCSAEHCCSFRMVDHRHSGQNIKTDSPLFSVKVTWSALARRV